MSTPHPGHVLFPPEVVAKLRENHAQTKAAQASGLPEPDHIPVVRIFNPVGTGTWLLTELLDDGDTLFGLCDVGEPELGYASKAELEKLRCPSARGLPPVYQLERDLYFKPAGPLSHYADRADHGEDI